MSSMEDFYECLKDSPAFKERIRNSIKVIYALEDELKQVSQRCARILNNGRSFALEFRGFVRYLEQVFLMSKLDIYQDSLFFDESFASDSMEQSVKFAIDQMMKTIDLFSFMLDDMFNDIFKRIISLIRSDIEKVRRHEKAHNRLSIDYASAISRNAECATRRFTRNALDNRSTLHSVRTSFMQSSVDYVFKIKGASIKFQSDFLSMLKTMLSMKQRCHKHGCSISLACSSIQMSTFDETYKFMIDTNMSRLSDLVKNHESAKRFCNTSMSLAADTQIMTNLSKSLAGLSFDYETDDTRSPSISTKSSMCDSSFALSSISECYHEGYLFKRSNGRFRNWTRKWFILKNRKLVYMNESAFTSSSTGAFNTHFVNNINHFKRRNRNHNNNNTNNKIIIDTDPLSSSIYVTVINDIRLCNVRITNDTDRRFVFLIQSPTLHIYLQADSFEERRVWIEALHVAIMSGIQSPCFSQMIANGDRTTNHTSNSSSITSNSEDTRSTIIRERKEVLQTIPGNNQCCDCNAYRPEWVSINLGILLCLKCSGIHRGLGVSTSKIRSLHMDDWDVETLLSIAQLGNSVLNAIYEGNLCDLTIKPTPCSPALIRKRFIDAKYVQKKFVIQQPSELLIKEPSSPLQLVLELLLKNEPCAISAQELLKRSVTSESSSELIKGNLPGMLAALAMGADRNHKFEELNGKTALMLAIENHCVPACEFLLQNGIKSDEVDNDGRSAMHYAVSQPNKYRCLVILLLKRNATGDMKDICGRDPLDYALSKEDPDVITWLRLVRLNKELEDEDPELEKCFLPFLDDPAYLQELANLYPL